jgi:hypothetical protein
LHISGSRVALAFLVELGAAMMIASTMVPERKQAQVLLAESRFVLSELDDIVAE